MLSAIALFAALGLVPPLPASAPITFASGDGVTVYAQPYPAPAADAPVILLFHQAGSSKAEYAPIAPRLAELGFDAVAVDLRSGGDMYPPGNETVQHLGHSATYEQALPDMEAALAWAHRTHPKTPVYVWGSSYSAALVFLLAAKHPKDVAAVLAFSPGEYLSDKHAVRRAAANVRVPVFIDTAADKSEIANGHAIFLAVAATKKEQFRPRNGVHGASTLRADRDPSGVDENWQAVTNFLRGLRS
jgi:dienelactone hydrolase